MESDVFVPFIFFGFLAAVILVPILAKEHTKRSAHQLISHAIDRGQPLDMAILNQLSEGMLQETNNGRKSLGKGVILLALAGGFAATAFVVDGFDPGGDARNGMFVPAIIFAAVGVAFLLLAIIDYAAKKPAS